MSDQDIFDAKIIILDILGWGIPAQYLLDFGVTPVFVVVCMTELRLRIPEVLDVIIDEAEREAAHIQEDSEGPDLAENQPTSLKFTTPHPPPINTAFSMATSTGSLSSPVTSTLPSRPSFLPPKPPTSSPPAPLDSNMPNTSAPSIPMSSTATLAHSVSIDPKDLEQQRKQELLARRAVMQSRRGKSVTASPTMAPSAPITPTVVRSPPANDIQIDMFIADVISKSGAHNGPLAAGPADHYVESPVEGVDTDFEHPSSHHAQEHSGEPHRPHDTISGGAPVPPSSGGPSQFGFPGHPNLMFPGGTGLNTPALSAFMSPRAMDSPYIESPLSEIGTLPIHAQPLPHANQPRPNAIVSNSSLKRVGKRPVAADFVDYVATESSSSTGPLSYPPSRSSTYHENGPPHKRRKQFGPVMPPRLVIDVSDEEESDGEGPEDIPGLATTRMRQLTSITPTPSDRATSVPTEKVGSDAQTWEQKQAEIAELRELIRVREGLKREGLRTQSTLPALPVQLPSSGSGTSTPVSLTRPPLQTRHRSSSATSSSDAVEVAVKAENSSEDSPLAADTDAWQRQSASETTKCKFSIFSP